MCIVKTLTRLVRTRGVSHTPKREFQNTSHEECLLKDEALTKYVCVEGRGLMKQRQ